MSDIKFYGPVHTLSGKKYKDDNITFLTQERTRRVYTRMSSPGQRAGHTPAQQAARTAFTNLRHEAQAILADPQQRKTYFSRWKRQHRFHTLLGFIMHSLSTPHKKSVIFLQKGKRRGGVVDTPSCIG